MSDLEKAARMALEALKQIDKAMPFPVAKFAQAALRQALEQPAQQKPVGYVYSVHGERIKNACIESDVPNGTPLYILPQRKPWVGLTWDDMPDCSCDDPAFLAGAQWANSKLKEKNA